MSEIKDLYCGFNPNEVQKVALYLLSMAEFAKKKHLRTTPYLLMQKVLKITN